MRVLVLRPERAATRTAARLVELGHEPILAPVLSIEEIDSPIPGGPYDGVLATSANGLRKLAKRDEIKSLVGLPLVAVGDRTAEAGREAGFLVIHVAEGDGRALVAETCDRFPEGSHFLHAAGADRAYDIAGALGAQGRSADVVELYAAIAATTLPQPAADALAKDGVDVVLHHSRRIAETFLALADASGFGARVRALGHAALATRVASALTDDGCERVAIAERPDEAALFDALATFRPDGSQSAGPRSN